MKRALIVIDVQNEYIDGDLPISYPAVHTSLANIATAMDTATANGIATVVVRQLAPETSPIFAHGSHGAELHPTVAERPHDLLMDKTLPSCFASTSLAEWLAERHIDTVTVAGYMTQNCVESTVRDAAHRGLAVEVLADATGTLAMANSAGELTAQALHETTMVVLQSRFAAVATTTDWTAAATTNRELERSNIYASTAAGRRK